jgi:hypothetical protein
MNFKRSMISVLTLSLIVGSVLPAAARTTTKGASEHTSHSERVEMGPSKILTPPASEKRKEAATPVNHSADTSLRGWDHNGECCQLTEHHIREYDPNATFELGDGSDLDFSP